MPAEIVADNGSRRLGSIGSFRIMATKESLKRTGAKGVDKYIANTPKQVQGRLKAIRATIRKAAPGAAERTDYFQMPGYSYAGYDYDGMFVWFSFKNPYVRLHLRPPVIQNHEKALVGCVTTKAIVSFPEDRAISMALVKKLVKASLKVMKDKSG
jgi:uncharacterized protein YdhG (YjbR/CyaY superfamily)